MGPIRETTILDEEEDALRAELEWIFSQGSGEVERTFAEISRLIKSCYERLNQGSDSSPDHSQGTGYYSCPLTMENDTVKGFVVLTGHSITKATIQLKFPKFNKGYPFATSITPSAPWIVHQIKNAANHLLVAETEMNAATIQLAAMKLNFKTDKLDLKFLCRLRNFSTQALEKVMKMLHNAKTQLVRPQAPIISGESPEIEYQSVFNPRLPEGVALEFHVDDTSLITDIYVYSALNNPPTQKKPSHCKIEGRWCEVEEHIELESCIPSLADSLGQINTAYEICQRLKDNLAALSAVG